MSTVGNETKIETKKIDKAGRTGKRGIEQKSDSVFYLVQVDDE